MYFENFDLESVVTPVDYRKLEQLLLESEYSEVKTHEVVKGFKDGFDLSFRGEIDGVQRYAPNLILRVGSPVQLWNKIIKEVKLKRYVGPFEKPPFESFIQSPVGLVPKSNGDTRLIFHLSYPRSGSSVNSQIPDDLCTVNYPDFSDAILKCLEEGVNCSIAKTDMDSAFRQLGIKPEQWNLLILKVASPFDGKTYYFCDKCLPFGASVSCRVYQKFSNCLAHVASYRSKKSPVNYLDDFYFLPAIKTAL